MKRINLLKTIVPCAFISLSVWSGFAQAPQQYIDFVTGSVKDKTAILSSLVISSDTPDLVASMPEEALEFIQKQVPLIGTESGMKDLALVAIPILQVENQNQGALLWNIFGLFEDSQVKVEVLETLAKTASVNKRLVSPYLEGVHTFVAESVASNTSDFAPTIAAVKLLGQVADSSSFEILFRLLHSTAFPELNQAIEVAFSAVIPSAQTTLLQQISQDDYSPAEKYRLFLIVQKNENISQLFKAELAENALSNSIIKDEDVSKMSPELISLQLAAIQQISDSDWTRAATTVADYFVMAQKQFESSLITSQQFISVVRCLEQLATSHSVSVLSDYLSVLNTAAAQDLASVDEEVLLAVIKSLGALGDKSAFDNLLYVTYLPYSETITTAARTALAGLKW